MTAPHKSIHLLCLRLEGNAGGITAGARACRADRNLTCRAEMLTVVIGAVLDVAADAVNVLRLAAAAAFLMIHDFISFR